MIVAFLDLLGFSDLVRKNIKVANDNLNSFNEVIKTRIIDNALHPIEEYKEQGADVEAFAKKLLVTEFKYMISISDSIVLGGEDCNIFIEQLINFISTLYIQSSESFRKSFCNIDDVFTTKSVDADKDGNIHYHNAFPILFRGGVAVGNNIGFFNEYRIQNSDLKMTALNVMGEPYLNAVQLERIGKGPRLFCDSSVISELDDKIKKYIKIVDKEKKIYEIVWTIAACDAVSRNLDSLENVKNSIDYEMLPAAINLYKYYRNDHALKPHYMELLKLVCTGIIKYAKDECDKEDEARYRIKKVLEKEIDYLEDILLEDFLA